MPDKITIQELCSKGAEALGWKLVDKKEGQPERSWRLPEGAKPITRAKLCGVWESSLRTILVSSDGREIMEEEAIKNDFWPSSTFKTGKSVDNFRLPQWQYCFRQVVYPHKDYFQSSPDKHIAILLAFLEMKTGVKYEVV